MKYFSMFSGIGGFELGINQAFFSKTTVQSERQMDVLRPTRHKSDSDSELGNGRWSRPICIGYSEIDKYAIKVYERNFNGRWNQGGGEQPREERQQTTKSELHTKSINSEIHNRGGHTNYGDATTINAKELPDFDLLVGGFPCQAFSVAGKRKGFDDTRGTLFFDIARILAEKRPRHLVLENVKGLLSHDSGKTFQTILGVLSDLGYRVEWQVLNSKDFGVPQNRERIFIVGHLGGECSGKVFPITGTAGKDINQLNPGVRETKRIYGEDGASPTLNTAQGGQRVPKLAIDMTRRAEESYRERKDNISGTVTATYYKGIGNAERPGVKEGTRIRRLTPLECERLQGFPDNWTAGESNTQRYKMCGNAVTVNVVEAVMKGLLEHETTTN